jgi:hypothetical protein
MLSATLLGQPATPPTPDLESLMKVGVTTASRFSDKLAEAPSIMSVVTSDELRVDRPTREVMEGGSSPICWRRIEIIKGPGRRGVDSVVPVFFSTLGLQPRRVLCSAQLEAHTWLDCSRTSNPTCAGLERDEMVLAKQTWQ